MNREREEEERMRNEKNDKAGFEALDRVGQRIAEDAMRNALGPRLQFRLREGLHGRLCAGCGHNTGEHSMPEGCELCSCKLFILQDILSWLGQHTTWIALDGHYGMSQRLQFYAHQGYYLIILAVGRTTEARIFAPGDFDFSAYRKTLTSLILTEDKQPDTIIMDENIIVRGGPGGLTGNWLGPDV